VARLVVDFEGNSASLQQAIDGVSRKLDGLSADAARSTSKVTAQLDKLEANFKDTFSRIGSGVARFGTLIGTALAGGGLAVAFKQAAAFETAIANVGSILSTTEIPLKNYAAAIREVGRDTSKDLVDLTNALYDTISAGVPAALGAKTAAEEYAKSIQFVKAASDAAVAGLASTKDAVNVAAIAFNTFGPSIGSVENVFDAFFKTVQRGVVTFPQLASTFGTVASSAAQAGVSFDETLAAIAALTKGGLDSARATTFLNAAILNILKPPKEAQKEFEKLGVQFGEAALKSKGLVGVVTELARATGGSAEALSRAIPATEAFRAVQILASKDAAAFNEELGQQAERAGATAQALAVQSATVEFQIGRIRNEFSALASEVFEELQPSLVAFLEEFRGALKNVDAKDIANALKSIGSVLASVIETIIKFGDVIVAVFAVKAVNALGRFVAGGLVAAQTGLASFSASMAGLPAVAGAASTAARGFGGALRFALGPLGLIIVAIEAAVVAGRALATIFGDIAIAAGGLDQPGKAAESFAKAQGDALKFQKQLFADVETSLRKRGAARAGPGEAIFISEDDVALEKARLGDLLRAAEFGLQKARAQEGEARAAGEADIADRFRQERQFQDLRVKAIRDAQGKVENLAEAIRNRENERIVAEVEKETATRAKGAAARGKIDENAAKKRAKLEQDLEDFLIADALKIAQIRAKADIASTKSALAEAAKAADERAALADREFKARQAAIEDERAARDRAYEEERTRIAELLALNQERAASVVNIVRGIGGGLDGVVRLASSALDGVIDQAVEAGNVLGAGLAAAAQLLVDAFGGLLVSLGSQFRELVSLAGTTGPGQGEAFRQDIRGRFQDAKDFIDGLVENLPILFDELGPFIDEFSQKLIDQLPRIVDAFAKGMPKVIEALARNVGPIIDAIVIQIPVIIEALVAQLPTLITALLEEIVPRIPDIAFAIVDGVINAFVNNIDRIIVAFIDGIEKAFNKLIEKLTGGLLGGEGGLFGQGGGALGLGFDIPGIPFFQSGGIVDNMTGANEIPAILHRGEGVITANRVRELGGASAIDAINQGASVAPSVNVSPVVNVNFRARGGDSFILQELIGRVFVREVQRQGASGVRTAAQVASQRFAGFPRVSPIGG